MFARTLLRPWLVEEAFIRGRDELTESRLDDEGPSRIYFLTWAVPSIRESGVGRDGERLANQ